MYRYGAFEYNWDGTDIRELPDEELEEQVRCEYEDTLYDELRDAEPEDGWIEEDE